MTRQIKAKPQIKKREAMRLAQQAETDPLGVLQTIEEQEHDVMASISLWRYGPKQAPQWHCGLSFDGADYAAAGRGATPGAAVKQAILRAYDTGAEKDWQLREKSFQGEPS